MMLKLMLMLITILELTEKKYLRLFASEKRCFKISFK